MRIMAILFLVVAFFVAVILPNEVGTHDLPATGAKHVLVKAHPHPAKPGKGMATALVTLIGLHGESALSRCDDELSRSVQTVCNMQLSLPLVI
jgi:hypothetical protein